MTPQSFTISNFKSFGNAPAKFILRPITLIFGPNSSGKSSLLQSLMYLDDVLENGNPDVIAPRAGGGKVDLGGFKQTLHRPNTIGHIVLGLSYHPDILSDSQRRWWNISESITINLTLGPLSRGGSLGNTGMSLEMDGRELLRASRNKEGPFKIDLFDFTHPAISRLLATIGAGRMDGDEETAAFGYDPNEDHLENINLYFNYLIAKGAFQLRSDDLLVHSLEFGEMPELGDIPNEDDMIVISNFATRWEDHLDTFQETTLPKAFEAVFKAFRGNARTSLASLKHVPPLRDLPPRVFDLNQHPNPLWRKIANHPELRKRINRWLGADFMKSRYELQVREFSPVDEFDSNLESSLEETFLSLFEHSDLAGELNRIYMDLWEQYENLDHLEYIKTQPALYVSLIQKQLDDMIDHASDCNSPDDRDWLLLPSREKWLDARNTIERSDLGDWRCYDEIRQHFFDESQEVKALLNEKWDGAKTAKLLKDKIFPAGRETRKEIALAALPSKIKVSLQDVGVGISQVLPVLMTAFGETESIVAIEQPEIHIHPALQAELADVFIESALGENKNTFLLETHSEHLILRLLKRVRETTEGDFSEWPEALRTACPNGIRPEDIAVLYVQPGTEGSEIIELPVTPDGDFSRPWPSGFFTERDKELF
jgi:hypothetical protein